MKSQEILGIKVKESADTRNLGYDQYVAEVSKFDRTVLLLRASDILWQIWRNPSEPAGREHDYSLCRTYISRVVAIAAANCQNTDPPKAITESEFINLVHEYLGIVESVTDRNFFHQHEGPRFLKALQEHETFRNYVPPVAVLHAYASRLTVLRTLRAQWDYRAVSLFGIFRSWDIVSRLDKRHHGWIFDRLKKALNIEPRDYIRAGMALLASDMMSGQPGVIIPRKLTVDKEVTDSLNLDAEALLFVANRLSQTCDDLELWHKTEVNPLPEPYRKYAPHPLVAQPLIRLDKGFRGWVDDEIGFLCPSPPHLVWNMQSACIEAIRKLPKYTPTENLMAELGSCLSDYLHDFLSTTCDPAAVVELDEDFKHQEQHQQEQHADFVVVAGDLALVIESKTSLGPTSAKSIVSPEDTVAIWSRMLRAYQQCAHTINSNIWSKSPSLAKAKRFVSIVCFDEAMCPDGAAFNDYGVRSGVFKALSLGPTEAVSLQDLENLLGTFGAERLGNMILNKWASDKHGDLLRTFAQSSAPDTEISSPTKHLRKAATELLPGSKLPYFGD